MSRRSGLPAAEDLLSRAMYSIMKNTCFFNAILSADTDAVRHMIEEGNDINKPYKGVYPLHHALTKGSLSAVQVLLDHGADASVQVNSYMNCLYYASNCWRRDDDDNYEVYKLLLERGVDCNVGNLLGETLLHRALKDQPLKIVKLFLDHGADITAVDMIGKTALHFAAMNHRHTDVLVYVLDRGFDIESCDKYDQVPLHFAAMELNFKGCELLLKRGANIDKKNGKALGLETPLKLAVKYHVDEERAARTVGVFLKYDADITDGILKTTKVARCCLRVKNLLIQYIAKMRYSKLQVSEDDLQIIRRNGRFKKLYLTCLDAFKVVNEDAFGACTLFL